MPPYSDVAAHEEGEAELIPYAKAHGLPNELEHIERHRVLCVLRVGQEEMPAEVDGLLGVGALYEKVDLPVVKVIDNLLHALPEDTPGIRTRFSPEGHLKYPVLLRPVSM